MPWRFSEDNVPTLSSSTDSTEDKDRPQVLGGLHARCKVHDVRDKYSKKTGVTPSSGSHVLEKSSEESKRSIAVPQQTLPDHNQNMMLLKTLSDSSGNLLSAKRIMKEVFKTDVRQMGLSSKQNIETDHQPVEFSQNEEIDKIKTPCIRPAKRKSFPKPIPIKMIKSSRPHQTKHKSSRPFPPTLSPSPQPTIPSPSHTKCFSCPRKCQVSAEGELACCKVCKKAQTKLFQAAAKISRGKLGKKGREELDEIPQPDNKTSDVEHASDDGQSPPEHCKDSKLDQRVFGAGNILPVGGLSPSSTSSQCIVSMISLAHNSPHQEPNSILPILGQDPSSSLKSEETLSNKMEIKETLEIINIVESGKSVKELSAVSNISQMLSSMLSCSEPEENYLDISDKNKNFDEDNVDAQTLYHGMVPDLLSFDKCANPATPEVVDKRSGSLLSQPSKPLLRRTGGGSIPEGRVCKVKCRFVHNSVFKLKDTEKIKQLENLSAVKVSKSAQDTNIGKCSFRDIPDLTPDNASLVLRNHSPGTGDNIKQIDSVIFALTSVTPNQRCRSSVFPSSPPAPAPPLLTRPRRSSSSKRECPSCGKLSLLPGQAVCCHSCVAAQEQLFRQKRRKTFG